MWLFVLSIFLITTPIVHGNEESQLAFKELHYEVSKIEKEVQELYLEPDTAQIELDEKAKKVLEEYIPMDISSGLPEQVQLLDLKDKADEVKEMKSGEKQLSDIVTREWKAIEKAKKAEINENYANKDHLKDLAEKSEDYYQFALKTGREVDGSRGIDKPKFDDLFGWIKYDYEQFKEVYLDLVKELTKFTSSLPDFDHIAFDFLEVMNSDIAEGKEKIREILKLKEEVDLSQKIVSVKGEIKVMEELRDSKVVQKILDFMEKIKSSFESMNGSGLDLFEWKIGYFARKWIPIQNYFKNLKVPTGDLTKSLTKIEECIKTFDFSMDFSKDETDLLKLEKIFKQVRDKMGFYLDMKNVEKFKPLGLALDNMMEWIDTEPKDWDKFKNVLKEFEMKGNLKLLANVHELDDVAVEIQNLMKRMDVTVFNFLKTVTYGITRKITKIKEFLNCYSSSKIGPSEMESLMDQPKEVWNFDARPLESVLEVVYLFKEAHRFLVDKKQPVPIDGFPLTKEEVTGISDGLRILKAVLDYQKLWNEIPQNFSSFSLEIHSNLPSVQFPKDIDSLINFYSTQYQGPQRRRILKILEGVKDYSQFPSKLEKMNEAVGKCKNWRKEQNPDEQNDVGEELIDCAESTCELTLPEMNPEEKIEL
ncbi:hypothetical protein CAEBREN_17174 [Caenorhabditis brenneri]|uniref:Domain of unknown function WSN domain-containing protein n=1 Tax=Caenorhabditis brenneri TaxID=135651 RepID=G0NEB7_CAEBE|nr:hypothetical protein CAEBREN_17174 [Caenorhabditis brenneri]